MKKFIQMIKGFFAKPNISKSLPTVEEQFDIFLKTRAQQYDMLPQVFNEGWHNDWKRFIKLLNKNGYCITVGNDR